MALNHLSKAALSAAMRGGMAGWGEHGSANSHIRYTEKVSTRSRKRCHCGCHQRATNLGMVNGVCLIVGCELSVRRWVNGSAKK